MLIFLCDLGAISLKLLGGKLTPELVYFCTEKRAPNTLMKWHLEFVNSVHVMVKFLTFCVNLKLILVSRVT